MANQSSTRVRKRSRKNYRRNKHRLRPPPTTNFSKLWIWALVISISTQQVVSAGLLRQEFNGASQNGGESRMTAARFRRDAVKLGKAIGTLGHLAHVANGIALEIGLVDGTIDPGEVVAELLHMGSLTVDDITNLNQDNIDNVLIALGHNSSPDQAVLDLENRLVNLENMREISSSFENQETVVGLKEYKESLNSLMELKDVENSVTAVMQDVDYIRKAFGNWKVPQKTLTKTTRDMASVVDTMNTLEPSAQSFDSVISNITEVKRIVEKSHFIETLLSEAKFRELLKNYLDYKTSQPVLEESLSKVYQCSETASNARKDFESIQKLIDTKGPLHRQSFKYTHGFPNGPSDLAGLSEDVEHLTDYVPDSKVVKENLGETLKPLQELERKLTAVENQWKGLVGDSTATSNVIDQVFHLAGTPKTSNAVLKLTNLLKGCDEPILKSYPKPDPSDLETFRKKVETLNEAIGKISDFQYIDQFKNLQEVKKYFTVTGNTDDEKNEFVKNTLQKLKTDEKLIQFDKMITLLEENLKYLLDFIKNFTQGVDFTELDNYLSALLAPPKYKTYIKCLQDIDQKSFPVRDMIKVTEGFRKSSIPTKVENVFKKVAQSKKELTEAKATTEEIKNNPDLPPQIEILKSSFDKDGYKEISNKLGMGVQGLISIKKVREADIETLLGNVNDILKDAGEKSLSPEHKTSLKQLEEIRKARTSIDNFFKSSVGLQVFRRKRETGFKNFHQIFMDAQVVQGVSIDMKSLRDAMEELDTKTTPKYADHMKQLPNLEPLEFDFTKFNFQDVPSSLTALDNFFLEYAAKNTATSPLPIAPSPVTPPSAAPDQQGSPGQQVSGLATADQLVEATTPGGGTGIPWGIVLPALGVFAFICFLIWCICFRKRKVPADDDSLLPSPDDDSQVTKDKKDDKGNKDDEEKQKGGEKKDESPKPPPPPPPPTGGANPPQPPPSADGSNPPPPPPPPTDQGGTNPPAPPTDQGSTAPPPTPAPTDQGATVPPPSGAANDQAGAAAVPPPTPPVPPAPVGIPDDEALAMVKKCNQAIRYRATQGESPKDWASSMYASMFVTGKQMLTEADTEGENQRRYWDQYCIKNTMAKITGFLSDFINCNVFHFGKKLWLAAQGPMDGTEEDGKKDTRPEHQAVIHQNGVGLVLQLCRNMEEVEEDGKKVLKKKSAEYYSEIVGETVTNGGYEMKTVERIDNPEQFTNKEDFTLFKLESTYIKEKETKPVHLLLYKGWPDHSAPEITDPALEMIRFADSYDQNVLVHCSAGVGRTGTLIAIKQGIEQCQATKVDQPNEIISPLRKTRYGLVQDLLQLTYFVLCVTKGIMIARGIEYSEDYDEMEYYHRQCLQKKYDFEKVKNQQKTKADRGAAKLIAMKTDQQEMLRVVKEKKDAHAAKEKEAKSKNTKAGKKPKSNGKKDQEGEEKISKASTVSSGSENKSKRSEKTAISGKSQKNEVLGDSQENPKKSEKNSKTSAAIGGSQMKSKKSQKDSKASAAPSGSQEKSKKKSSRGEEKKSEKKTKTSADQKKNKRKAPKSKPTKKGKAKAK